AEALATVKETDGSADALRAAVHNNLGGLRYYRGNYRESLEAYRTALALFRARGSDADVAKVLNNMGPIQVEMGDPRGAREDLLQALKLKESLFGPDDPRTASTVENLAAADDALGERQRAVTLHARAAAIYRKKLGPRHPKLAQVFQAWGLSRQN